MIQPDNWIIIKIVDVDGFEYYKLLVSWMNEWKYRITRNISDYYEDEDDLYFISMSGATYRCDRNGYGASNFVEGPIKYYASKFDGQFIPLTEMEAYKVVMNRLWRKQ